MLARLQQRLHETYQTSHDYDVRDFLITDQRLASLLSGASPPTAGGEALLVHEDDSGLSLSLYLEEAMLERLESADPLSELQVEMLDDLCKVIEGLSHFNYVAWRAQQDRGMSLLELELQAEIDKFVSTMEIAREQRDTEMLNRLHDRLFGNPMYRSELDEEQLERYRAATEYAGRFCNGLRQRLLHSRVDALTELRHFYRLPLNDKISHIHTRSWVAS